MNLLPAILMMPTAPLSPPGAGMVPLDLPNACHDGLFSSSLSQSKTPFAAILAALSTAGTPALGSDDVPFLKKPEQLHHACDATGVLPTLLAVAGATLLPLSQQDAHLPQQDNDSGGQPQPLANVHRWIEKLQQILASFLPEAAIALDQATLRVGNGAVHFAVTLLEQTPKAMQPETERLLQPPTPHLQSAADAAQSIGVRLSVSHGVTAPAEKNLPIAIELATMPQQVGDESVQQVGTLEHPAGVQPSVASDANQYAGQENMPYPEDHLVSHTQKQPTDETLPVVRQHVHAQAEQPMTDAHVPLETGLRAVLRATVTALWQSNQSAARIVLQPESLGTIVVHLAMRGPETVVQIIVSSAETYSTVSQTVESLRTELHTAGVRADAIAVRLAEPMVAERSPLSQPVLSGIAAIGDDQTNRRQKQQQHRQRSRSRSRDHEQFEHFM